jgi:hypothetical protein
MLTPEEVFITDGFPRLTYVDPGGGKPEADLKEGLAQANKIISIVGASKTGKSTLCDKHFGSAKILVTGDQINDPDVMWSEAYRQIGGQVTSGYAMNVLGATIEAIVNKGNLYRICRPLAVGRGRRSTSAISYASTLFRSNKPDCDIAVYAAAFICHVIPWPPSKHATISLRRSLLHAHCKDGRRLELNQT